MMNLKELEQKIEELCENVESGKLEVKQAMAINRLIRERARLIAMKHRAAEAQGKLKKMNAFYGLED